MVQRAGHGLRAGCGCGALHVQRRAHVAPGARTRHARCAARVRLLVALLQAAAPAALAQSLSLSLAQATALDLDHWTTLLFRYTVARRAGVAEQAAPQKINHKDEDFHVRLTRNFKCYASYALTMVTLS